MSLRSAEHRRNKCPLIHQRTSPPLVPSPIDVAPADFTAALLNQLKNANPNLTHIPWTIRGEPYGEQKGIGFALRNGETTELSLMLYQRSPEGNGLLTSIRRTRLR
ncbi:MAG TPA: hypothetical protein DDZ51_11360 [Planctomycetaceae bacterium]|nr:hypothetical protein [Planctomycetaceae bacterium]